MWSYEVHHDGKVIDVRGGYRTAQEAKAAGERAKDFMEAVRYPLHQELVVRIKRE